MAFGPTRRTLKSELALAAVVAATAAFAGGPARAFPPEDPPCPTSVLTRPQGGSLAPVPAHCTTPNCLVSFKGYQWWTSYQHPFYNGGLQTKFAPEHASIGIDGNLHLVAADDIDLGEGHTVWAGAEAVLMFHGDGSEANLGYGDYLVTAKLASGGWDALDPNMAFGLFTYENPPTGPHPNHPREIDLAEISRWGWNHTGNCPFTIVDHNFPTSALCKGNAQFALQEIMLANKEKAPTISAVIKRSRWSCGGIRGTSLYSKSIAEETSL
jgi:hypothetical protein